MASEPIPVRMPARAWATIDAGADNAAAIAAQGGDEPVLALARSIREAGWAQVPWVDGEWPPDDQVITIGLTRAQWRFAAADLREGIPVCELIGDAVSAQLCRDALAIIEAAGVL